MPLEDLTAVDDLDSRREIFRILQLLDPIQSIDFLHWCAARSFILQPDGSRVQFVVTHSTGETSEVYWDLMQLIVHHGIDLATMLRELERRASCRRLAFGVA